MHSRAVRNSVAVATIAVVALFGVKSASAVTYVYDLKAAANSGGGIGESIFSTFSTSSFAGFVGPNLDITASATNDDDSQQYVYFDNGNGGIGVCKDAKSGAPIGTATNGSTNYCYPGSDDGITDVFETLTFTATTTAMIIQSIWMNANHDSPSVFDATYSINGVPYGAGSMVLNSLSGTGDVRIDLGFTLNVGDFFSITPLSGSPDSYISGIAISPVPVPAAGLLLLSAFGGLAAVRRRRQKLA